MKNKNNHKIILITGATSGIGKETAVSLAKLGETVIFTSRTSEAGEKTATEIKERSGNKNVEYFVCDLDSFESIKKFNEDFREKYNKLNVLINNAGVMPVYRRVSRDGLELNLAVNYLAPFMLTNLLLDVLKKGAPSRIINVSSSAHSEGVMDFSDLNSNNFDRYKAYSQSKLALILFTKKLSKLLKNSGITVNCVHPGVVKTRLSMNALSKSSMLVKLFFPLTMSTPQKAASALTYLAVSPDVENVSGEYFIGKKISQPAPQSLDTTIAEKLWSISLKIINQGGLK